jgi:hypothetical protein
LYCTITLRDQPDLVLINGKLVLKNFCT